MDNLNTSTNCAAYQLFDVIADPSERNDLYGKPGYDAITAGLKEMYQRERAIAVYPCIRGPAGKANAAGVLQPWLGPNDLCEAGDRSNGPYVLPDERELD